MSYRLLSEADLKGKRVLLRAGFDLPMDEAGNITDTTRVQAIEKTMRHILDAAATLIIMAHQGRPKDAPNPQYSQRPLVPFLEKLLKTTVHFSDDCIGPTAEKTVADAQSGEVVLLENLRFHAGEKKNDSEFSVALSRLGDIYVNDAFTNCHRNHASMVGVPAHLPSFMGFTLEQEVAHLSTVVDNPMRPLTLIVAGAKMETKVPVIQRFLETGDNVLVGGCIANTLIAAQNKSVGSSKFDADGIELAQSLLQSSGQEHHATIHVPTDASVAHELSDTAQKQNVSVEKIDKDMAIFDIGDETVREYVEVIRRSKLIVWNGPLGVYEHPQYADSTKKIAEAVQDATKAGAISIIGGGDTIDFHLKYDVPLSAYTFVSMGGGAMLEYISGKQFASLDALKK